MSRMIVVAIAVAAALLGSALTFGFGAIGSAPVRAAPAQAAPVQAQSEQLAPVKERAPYTQAVMESRVKERFSGTDQNKDGFVTRRETELASETARAERRALAFGAMDRDKNGSVSRAEFDAHADARRDLYRQSRGDGRRNRDASRQSARRGFIGTRQFEQMDTNQDDRVSLDEALVPSVRRFERSDINGDGRLTAAERKAARQRYRGEKRSWRKDGEWRNKERRDVPT